MIYFVEFFKNPLELFSIAVIFRKLIDSFRESIKSKGDYCPLPPAIECVYVRNDRFILSLPYEKEKDIFIKDVKWLEIGGNRYKLYGGVIEWLNLSGHRKLTQDEVIRMEWLAKRRREKEKLQEEEEEEMHTIKEWLDIADYWFD
jgi:hypothetical protein